MREFEYKGAIVRPYEPFNAHQSYGYTVGSIRGRYALLYEQTSMI